MDTAGNMMSGFRSGPTVPSCVFGDVSPSARIIVTDGAQLSGASVASEHGGTRSYFCDPAGAQQDGELWGEGVGGSGTLRASPRQLVLVSHFSHGGQLCVSFFSNMAWKFPAQFLTMSVELVG